MVRSPIYPYFDTEVFPLEAVEKANSLLLELADFIISDAVTDDTFDLSGFVTADGLEDHLDDCSDILKFAEDHPEEVLYGNICGTAACALGWAGSLKSWQDEGFSLDFNGDCYFPTINHAASWPDDPVANTAKRVRSLLCMDKREYTWVFWPEHYPPAERSRFHVAGRIRSFVRVRKLAAQGLPVKAP